MLLIEQLYKIDNQLNIRDNFFLSSFQKNFTLSLYNGYKQNDHENSITNSQNKCANKIRNQDQSPASVTVEKFCQKF